MLTKLWSLLLTGTLILTTGEFPALAQECEQAHQSQFLTVKAIMMRLGTGEAVHVKLTLADKSRLSGYVSEANDDSFLVTNPTSQARVRVGYGEPVRLRAENSATGLKLSFPVGRQRIGRTAIHFASLGIAGHDGPAGSVIFFFPRGARSSSLRS